MKASTAGGKGMCRECRTVVFRASVVSRSACFSSVLSCICSHLSSAEASAVFWAWRDTVATCCACCRSFATSMSNVTSPLLFAATVFASAAARRTACSFSASIANDLTLTAAASRSSCCFAATSGNRRSSSSTAARSSRVAASAAESPLTAAGGGGPPGLTRGRAIRPGGGPPATAERGAPVGAGPAWGFPGD